MQFLTSPPKYTLADNPPNGGLDMEYSYMLSAEADKYPAELRDTVFADTIGDNSFPEFQRLLEVVKPDDRLNIPTLSDLGYNLSQISEKWQELQKRQVNVWILDCPAFRNKNELFGEFLRYVSYSQQKNPRRQVKAMPAASKAGYGPGRKRMQLPDNFEKVYEDYYGGKLNSREAGEALNVSHTTFLRWCSQMETA